MTMTVAELWRYPVKSFQGERVEQLTVSSGGAVGDRMLAVVDPAARKVLSAKRYADLLQASARLEGGDVVVTLPDGKDYEASDPAVHTALSAWLDLADAHFLTTASLRAAAALHPEGDWDVRRFRPTALIETDDAGFVEESWTTFSVGPVEADLLMKTMRCSMPSRAQPGIERDMKIGTTLRDQNANNLGIYAAITKAGTIAVGDAVTA
jgi:uncharacterized protein YcbX